MSKQQGSLESELGNIKEGVRMSETVEYVIMPIKGDDSHTE